jgi:TrmH family RNA methyltransferase
VPERPDLPVLSNPRSERVRSAARLAGRSARSRAGAFLVEGPQAVREAVAGHRPGGRGAVRELFVTPEGEARHPDVVGRAAASGVPVRRCTPEVLAALADTRTPQGLVAACDLVAVDAAGLADVLARRPRLVAVLAHVRDPGNAGTVIRAADAAGADAVVLTDASVDVHNPKCVRSTAGSLFHLDVVTGVPLDAAVAGLRAAGLRVLAADGAGRTDLDDLEDAGALGGPVAWVLGNEAWGLGEEDRALADDVVRVPIHGRAESLNLAMAATVCLYATARAQRHATAHP